MNLPQKARILLADDHAVLRAGLKLLISNQPDMEVVGEAEDGTAVLPLAQSTNPHLILLDLSMPRLGGLDILPLIRQTLPQTRVLILTMHDDESYLRRALKAGAAGYVLKKAADVELLSAIRAVLRGDVYVHPTMTKALIEDMMPADDQHADTIEARWKQLSEREQEVLRMVALGYTGREIAEKLALSVKTVDTYRSRGMEKLGLRSRAALVRFALKQGLLEDI
ncbi:MAG: DNA-binding response regulator [Chloroflexi bacterium]|nr:MAG: DNA-binding response regulator [Chloroflexota bacterium]